MPIKLFYKTNTKSLRHKVINRSLAVIHSLSKTNISFLVFNKYLYFLNGKLTSINGK
jgi:hypothetical protein